MQRIVSYRRSKRITLYVLAIIMCGTIQLSSQDLVWWGYTDTLIRAGETEVQHNCEGFLANSTNNDILVKIKYHKTFMPKNWFSKLFIGDSCHLSSDVYYLAKAKSTTSVRASYIWLEHSLDTAYTNIEIQRVSDREVVFCHDCNMMDTTLLSAIRNHDEFQTIGVYPNPAKDKLTLDIDGDTSPKEVYLLDIHGNVMRGKSHLSQGIHKVDISKLTPGTYTLIMTSKNGQHWSAQFIKV